MKARENERQEPWLLIKEDDEEARPAAEYDVVEAKPDRVLKDKARGGKRGARGKKRRAATRASPSASSLPSEAVRAKLPLFFTPQLATLVDTAPEGDGWIYEVKFDGYRIVARIAGEDVKLFTRNGNDWTARLRSLADDLGKLGIASAWIDGEIVVMNDAGQPSFQLLQRAFDNANARDIVFFAFDLPHFGGYDLTRVPLIERRALLERIFEKDHSPRLRFSGHFAGPAKPLLDAACEQGLEGLIGKRAAAPYTSTRSTSWVKIKCSQRQEFVVVGHTDPKGSRSGFGSLLLAVHDEKTGALRYAGNVGTGFDQESLRSIKTKLEALATDKPPVAAPRGVKGHWVRPKLVAEVAFTEWTSEGRVRHPVFQGLRSDKDANVITREKPQHPPSSKGKSATVGGIKVSHGERVIDASAGHTKLDQIGRASCRERV